MGFSVVFVVHDFKILPIMFFFPEKLLSQREMKPVEFSLFTAAEMLDPKAKESSSSKSPFPWSRRETSTSSSNGGSPRVITKAPPVPAHSVHTVQSYAKSQEQQNATCLSKTEHRYGLSIV